MPDNSIKNKKNESSNKDGFIEVKRKKSGKIKISTGKSNRIIVKIKDFEYSI